MGVAAVTLEGRAAIPMRVRMHLGCSSGHRPECILDEEETGRCEIRAVTRSARPAHSWVHRIRGVSRARRSNTSTSAESPSVSVNAVSSRSFAPSPAFNLMPLSVTSPRATCTYA